MTTPMPASPFLSASDGLHPLSSVAAVLAHSQRVENTAAEIQSSPDVLLNLSEIEPSATLASASGETPAVIIPSRGTVAADRDWSLAQLVAGGFDTEAFHEAVEELPIFIRDGEHLRRWA